MTMSWEHAAADRTKFCGVLCDEAAVITAWRRKRRLGDANRDTGAATPPKAGDPGPHPATITPGIADDPATWTVEVAQLLEDGKPVFDDRDQPVPCMTSGQEIVGLSLSGGGVRSASFCLGVLQGLDAVVPGDRKPQIIEAVDYLSTVSGGGYMGASLLTGTLKDGKFPFTSKFDQMETAGTQHLRDYSNYLAPSGGMDWIVGVVVLLRGLLINALLVFGLVFMACAVTVRIYANEGRVGADWVPGLGWVSVPFLWTGLVFAFFILLQLPVVAKRIGLSPSPSATLREREWIGKKLAGLLLAVGLVLLLDLQSFVLKGLFDAVHLSQCRAPDASGHVRLCRGLAEQTGWLGSGLSRVGLGSGAPWGSLAAAVAALGAFGTKLVKVAGATFGDRSWSGFLKHWGSRIAIALGSLLVPLALWAVYLSLCFTAIQFLGSASNLACCGLSGIPEHPDGAWGMGWSGPALGFGISGAVFLMACYVVPTNANSLHDYYRDRLSRAFLCRDDDVMPGARNQQPGGFWTRSSGGVTSLIARIRSLRKGGDAPAPQAPAVAASSDRMKLSDLVPKAWGGIGDGADGKLSIPYLIINTAVNVEGSKYANRRGRNADSFTFSALHSGSAATGYAATSALEAQDEHLDLATAMAVSGAAASANMGASTIRPLTFSLAVLNVRLGYWLPNPGRLADWRRSSLERSWPVSFAREAAGKLDEDSPLVYLTDGGHFDNLGIYELLKRRCKVIITADAEADPPMNFESLIRLERCARIDLGVRIDLPWEDLRRWSRKITVDDPHGPDDDPADCIGPHVAVGRIQYTDDDVGVLIYIKACITGDENDLIRDYRRRNPDFPHETTLDQFFTEEQFEVYRALGFHATKSFFSGQDRFGFSPSHVDARWTALLRKALARLNVPAEAADRIVAQQTPKRVPSPTERRRRAWL